jgi:hypothetical protein
MGFDLWSALGITPATGIAIAAGGILLAALLALRIAWRDRSEARRQRALRLNDWSN